MPYTQNENIAQYVGARYVPKFYRNSQNPNSSEWEAGTAYEAMTIVTYNNSSYTSKEPVNAGIGNPADNPKYWVITGNYNAQVEQYREQTENYANEVTEYSKTLNNLKQSVGTPTTAFNTVHDLINSNGLNPGDLVFTKGYNTPYDNGETYFEISDTEKTDYDIAIGNIFARPIFTRIVYPEQFGAYGDNQHDDTNALTKCLAYAKNNHATIYSTKDKTYKVTDTLEIGNTFINFNGGTINSEADVAITINKNATSLKDLSYKNSCTIENCNVSCSNGIVIRDIRALVNNCKFSNVTGNAIDLELGYENTVRDCTINATGDNATGIVLNTSDSVIYNITGTNFKTGILMNTATNIQKVHLWISNINIYKGSVFIDANVNNCTLSECECDTYETFINSHTNIPEYRTIGCSYISNPQFVSADAVPTLYKINNNAYSYLRQYMNLVQQIGCTIQFPKSNENGGKTYRICSDVSHDNNKWVPIVYTNETDTKNGFRDLIDFPSEAKMNITGGSVLTDFSTMILVNLNGSITDDNQIFVLQNSAAYFNFVTGNFLVGLSDTEYGNPTSYALGNYNTNKDHNRLQITLINNVSGTKWIHIALTIPYRTKIN